VQPVDPAEPDRGRELLGLQRAAYAVEAALIGDDRIPQLTEDLAGLRAAGLSWLAASRDGRLLGAAAWSAQDGVTDLERLVVDPAAHRQGIGRALVRALLDRTAGPRVLVSTGRDNGPARALYRGLGFIELGDAEVLPGLWVTRFELSR
jgi:ribosomal protein S18 acetylase RimI-like enzyme